MDAHLELLQRIRNAIRRQVKATKSYIEMPYTFKGGEYSIDLLIQIGSTLYIFEGKKKRREKKAKKQLMFHKKILLYQRARFYWRNALLPFSAIKVYYVAEEENIIENIETGAGETFDPVFLENPFQFLNQ